MIRPLLASLSAPFLIPLTICLMVLCFPAHLARAQAAETSTDVASAAVGSTSASSALLTTGPITAKAIAPVGMLSSGNWQSLTQAQRQVLAPLAQDWDRLDSSRRSKWLEVATRFNALPVDEQARIRERMSEWAKLSPTERQEARVGFQSTQQIKTGELQAKWEAYQALPPERRQALAEKAALKTQPASAVTAAQASPHSLAKSNLVPSPSDTPITAIAPSILQAKPGATTVLITQGKTLPSHQTAGQPKVLADPSLVDPKTLLPKIRK